MNAQGGNDVLDASNLPANLIGLTLNGGDGSDTILGSQGNDLVSGGPGNDVAMLGSGDDTFVWNPGDGSDTVDGEAGTDTMVFNGVQHWRAVRRFRQRPDASASPATSATS